MNGWRELEAKTNRIALLRTKQSRAKQSEKVAATLVLCV